MKGWRFEDTVNMCTVEWTICVLGITTMQNVKTDEWRRCWDLHSDAEVQSMYSRPRERWHIHKGYDCCRRQTDMARRYPDDDPLRHLGSHSVALTVGLSMQRHHQHEIPARRTQTAGVHVTNGALTASRWTTCLRVMACRSPLVRVRFALLPHVICRGLAKVEPPNCDLCDLLWGKGDPGSNKITNTSCKQSSLYSCICFWFI